MATKSIDSNLRLNGGLQVLNCIGFQSTGVIGLVFSGDIYDMANMKSRIEIHEDKVVIFSYNPTDPNASVSIELNNQGIISMPVAKANIGNRDHPFNEIIAKKHIVPNGRSNTFLKADGSLDNTAYATKTALNNLQTALTNLQNNAWKLSEANAESTAVVLALQGNMSVFTALEKEGFNYNSSRNIYVDLSGADSSIDDIFAGFEKVPVGIRYHIFFGNTKADCKINWNSSKVESNIVPSLGLTPAYPTAKCEFMRVTEAWTYADWEAKINNVSHVVDTGTLDDTNNSILQGYLDKNGISYEKTPKGSLFNLANMLAALASSK